MYRCMDDSSTLVADATNKFILLIVFFVCVAVCCCCIVSCRVVCRADPNEKQKSDETKVKRVRSYICTRKE